MWDSIHYRDLERFARLLAIGQADIRVLKTLVVHALKAFDHQGQEDALPNEGVSRKHVGTHS